MNRILSLPLLVLTLLLSGSVDYRKLHFSSIVIDTHNDVAQRMLGGEDISVRSMHGQSDLPRFRQGGLDAEVFSIWVPPEQKSPSYRLQADRQIDAVEKFVARNSDSVGLAKTADDIERLVKEHKFVAMLGMEGGHPIDASLDLLDQFYARGVRYMTLTWNNSTAWATSARDEAEGHPKHKGLTEFGRKVVRKMNDLGMLVDVSHVGPQTFRDVMKTTGKPVIASHSSAWTLCHHWRNLKDDQLKAIAKNGGVVCINFAPWFIDSTFAAKERRMLERNKARIDSFKATLKIRESFLRDAAVAEFLRDQYRPIRPPLSRLIDHFDYVAKLIGVDHVGIGSDFDGIAVTPLGMDDASDLPVLTRELLARGYTEQDIRKILGENFLRVLRANERKP